jgi:hypothetical protein
MWDVRLTIRLEEMASKATEKRKYMIGKNEECNEFLLLKYGTKICSEDCSAMLKLKRNITKALLPIGMLRIELSESPVTHDCAFLLSLMLRD